MIAPPPTLAVVDDQPITVRDMEDLVAQVSAALASGDGFKLYTLNLDHLVKRRHSAIFRAVYARATFVTADGWPVVSLARRVAPSIRLTPGADLVVPLCRLAAEFDRSVALFGTSTAVLGLAAERLRALAPGLRVALAEAPPASWDPAGPEAEAAIARIAASGASLCFVALGAPKQETFADRAAPLAPGTGFVAIGAALDFIAGVHARAPMALRRARLEWAWRLARQPRRLGVRYARCALLFARLSVARAPIRSSA